MRDRFSHIIKRSDEPWILPHLGQRIVKTTVAVFLCLMFYYLRGYRGQDMPTEAAITAIICMQPYVRDTGEYALNRFVGTLIGAFWGLLLLLLLNDFPPLGANMLVLYLMMAAGVLLSLYSAVILRMPDASGLASIVFLCIVIAFPDIEEPLRQAAHRLLDVFVGTTIATVVNVIRLPRSKRRDLCFFVRTRDLVPDRFSHISPTARLEALGISYFTYTIHNDKTCIFHSGALREEEKLVYERMRSSPYRSYLEGEIYEAEEIVYFKVIATEKEIGEIEYSLRGVMPKGRMRRVVRPQAGREDLAALYIYAHTATMEQAGKRLMEMLRQDDETLKAVPVRLRGGYRSERDAIHLLHLVANAYEPVLLFGKRQDGEIVG